MAAKDELGKAGERRAARYLQNRGYEILARNWRCSQGEIDIVAVSSGWLCIVEVKTRTSAAYGHPLDAIDSRKLGRLWHLAYAWIAAHPDRARGLALRVEAVSIVGPDPASGEIEHLVDL